MAALVLSSGLDLKATQTITQEDMAGKRGTHCLKTGCAYTTGTATPR
jgi:hypothetical protein